MEVDTQTIVALQQQTAKIRNVCILAHVDHGKTTLSDHLIASNGLIHPRLAGELRYMDSNEDEQARGITMKSSSISLLHIPKGEPREVLDSGYLFNLIDSPGHIDFCSEVSTAARLSDGAFVLVDAVEGVCIQTHAVLRQAWEERLEMCLVINKIDRMILELELDPLEAYTRIVSIVSNVNMVLSSFESEKFISEADAFLDYQEDLHAGSINREDDKTDEDEEDYFSPEKGNVAFGSAFDGWAFNVQQFAKIYSKKLQCKAEPLHKALWGNYSFSAKSKRIVPIKPGSGGTPLFVSWILEPIFKAYGACMAHADHKGILQQLADKLNIDEKSKQLTQHADARVALRGFMRSWLPLSDAILTMGVQFLPNPRVAAPNRIDRFLTQQDGNQNDLLREVKEAITSCDTRETAPLVIYVSKMVSVPLTSLPRKIGQPSRSLDAKEETFLAFGRVFAGVIKEGQDVYVLQADYDPITMAHDETNPSISKAKINELYLMMGRGLEFLDKVPAGNILAMSGLEMAILKSATLSSTPMCKPIAPLMFQAAPIVQVAVEPAHPGDMEKFENGMKLLHRADPLVKVIFQDSGEHVLCAAGEVHLETCIKDLRERFARVELVVSPPLVRFKESIAEDTVATKIVSVLTAGKACELRIQIKPLTNKVSSDVETLEDVLVALMRADAKERNLEEIQEKMADLKQSILQASNLQNVCHEIWQFGPKRVGPNILLMSTKTSKINLWMEPDENVVHAGKTKVERHTEEDEQSPKEISPATIDVPIPTGSPHISHLLGLDKHSSSNESYKGDAILQLLEEYGVVRADSSAEEKESLITSTQSAIHAIISGISAGFQMASASGPLCDEPLRGILVNIQVKLCFSQSSTGTATLPLQEDVFGPFNGQVSAVVKQGIRRCMLENSPRIVEAHFLCEISTSSEGLAAVYAVLGRRRAKVLREELREGSGLFVILAHLPVEASFGFVDELRRKSSGSASASLMLSHWERLDIDPFFQPLTEEEREEFGEEGQGVGTQNLARRLIDAVRTRKGLPVEKKVVENATKQRTRARRK
ncbi:Elongation factor-like GTPase 1 [Picochlorum sp. SENEW3]|nr:Elongation factor-like GTPase 1 [Picochlorum sp. SENEW3]